MLDAIRQMMPMHATMDPAQLASAGRAEQGQGAFDRLFGAVAQPAEEQFAPRQAEKPKEPPPDYAAGWETADAQAYDDPQMGLAAQDQASSPPPDAAPAPAAESAAAPAEQARAANGPAASPANPAQGATAPAAEGQLVAALAEQLSKTPATVEPAAQLAATELLNPTAADAAAPEIGGGTPGDASTEASDPAVLKPPSEEALRPNGPAIEIVAHAASRPRTQPKAEATDKADQNTAKAGQSQPTGEVPSANKPAVTAPILAPPARPARQDQAVTDTKPADGQGQPAEAGPVAQLPSASGLPGPEATTASQLRGEPSQQAQSAGPVQGAEAAGAAVQSLDVDVDQLASRAVRWQRLGLLDGGTTARIRLTPPELGNVQVAMRTAGDSVRIQLTVQSESTRQLLQNNAERLSESLQSHGFQPSRIEVVVQMQRDEGAEGGDGRGGRQDQGGQQNSGRQGRQQDERFQQFAEQEMNLTA